MKIEDTNNVVHEIMNKVDMLDCGVPVCVGYEIALCGEAYDYQNETEGTYCMDGLMNNTYYNYDNNFYLFVDSCKLAFSLCLVSC